jgi:2'-5' RNA ligase
MRCDVTNQTDAAGRGQGESLRLFFTVELPDEVRAAASAQVERLRRDFKSVRASWARPASLHVTLKFLGEVEASRLDALSRAGTVAATGLAPFNLSVESAGAFPPRGAARVLWLGVRDDSGRLALLQSRLEDVCAAEGFERESKPFKPHLTLARLRTTHDAAALSEAHRQTPFGPHAFDVTEFLLMRSQLGPGGSRYTPLSRHSF